MLDTNSYINKIDKWENCAEINVQINKTSYLIIAHILMCHIMSYYFSLSPKKIQFLRTHSVCSVGDRKARDARCGARQLCIAIQHKISNFHIKWSRHLPNASSIKTQSIAIEWL